MKKFTIDELITRKIFDCLLKNHYNDKRFRVDDYVIELDHVIYKDGSYGYFPFQSIIKVFPYSVHSIIINISGIISDPITVGIGYDGVVYYSFNDKVSEHTVRKILYSLIQFT